MPSSSNAPHPDPLPEETDQAVRILTRANPRFAVDPMLRTPADTPRRYRQYDPLIRDALDNGAVLYAKRGARVGREALLHLV